jgi:SprT-like protein
MDNSQLQLLVEEISLQWFGEPFLHIAVYNTRLRTTAGRYIHGPHRIEINPRYHALHGEDELFSTIKHELCHYHLAVAKRPFGHGAADFRILLQKVGATRHAKPCPDLANKRTQVYLYICTKCRHSYPRRRRINTRRYVCGKCKGKLLMQEG